MNVVFTNAQWLGWLALAGLPILIHLVARARPPLFKFSSLIFLNEVARKTTRLRRPRDWMILACRTLALLALILAFLQPLLVRKTALASSAEQKTIVLLVDRSASMAFSENGMSRMSRAAARAKTLLDEAGGLTLANVIWIDANPEAVYPEPSPNRAYLTDQLQRAQAKPETGAVEAAWRLAMAQLERQKIGSAELFVFSDFQANGWRDVILESPLETLVVNIPVAEIEAANVAVLDLRSEPSQPIAGQPFSLRARVANYSDTPRRLTVFSRAGQVRQSQSVDLPAWSEAETATEFDGLSAGIYALEAGIEGDAFPDDDVRHAVLEVRETLRLVLVGGDLPEESAALLPLVRLGEAFSWLEVSTARALSDIFVASADVVYVSRWDEDDVATMTGLAENGTAVICQAVHGLSVKTYANLLGVNETGDAVLVAERDPDGWTIGIPEEHVLYKLYHTGEFEMPFEGRIHDRLRLPVLMEAEQPAPAVLATYRDGVPALLASHRHAAPIYLFNVPMDPAISRWSSQSGFVTFWGEFLKLSSSAPGVNPREVLPGERLTWSPPSEVDPTAVRLADPAGVSVPIDIVSSAQGTVIRGEAPARAGGYTWEISQTAVERSCANFPREESDLRTIDPDGVTGQTLSSSAAREWAVKRDGRPIWPWCLAAAALGLLAESLLLGGTAPATPQSHHLKRPV